MKVNIVKRNSGYRMANSSGLRSHRAILAAYLFLVPTFVSIGVFSYFPALRALVGAFTQWDGLNAPVWVGIGNFIKLFQDPVFLASLWRVLVWSIMGIILSIVPSFAVAALIFHLRSIRMQYVYRSLFVITMVLPPVVILLIWQYFYGLDGVVNAFLSAVGLGSLRNPWLANPHTALWAAILKGFPWIVPFNLLILYAGLQSIPPELFDAAAIDGITAWKRILYLEIPMILPQVKLLLILSLVFVSQDLLTPLLMTGGGPGHSTTTPVFYMYQSSIQYDEFGYGMAIAFLLFLVEMGASLFSMKYFNAEP